MASQLRQRWQQFKKNHPTFEKSKNFKSDVGPQLDKFDKARDEFEAILHTLEKKGAEVVVLGNSVAAALKGYQAVVKELQATDKTIAADFEKNYFDSFADMYVKHYGNVKLA